MTPKCKKRLLENDPHTPSPKKARKDLSLEEKLTLIADLEKTSKLIEKEPSEKYGIGRTTVSDILKKKDFFTHHYTDKYAGNKKRFTFSSKYAELNDLLFNQARAKNIPLSSPILQEKALHFSKELELTDLRASNGWLES
jgi:hypothetical protein